MGTWKNPQFSQASLMRSMAAPLSSPSSFFMSMTGNTSMTSYFLLLLSSSFE